MVKTRMAPSPTGEFHIGGMRTLLYNYAFARKNEGKFVLRIEDTDRERFVEGALERAIQVIRDYGLDWDEGPDVGGPNAPYIQSQRLELYKNYALELVQKGHAYYCFCSKERLGELRDSQRAAKLPTTRYDKHCLTLSPEAVKENLDKGVSYVIRLNIPANRIVSYEDLILGKLDFPSNDLDDQILLKSDGYPTYQLAVVIDDHLMGISHILRGMEWLPSTPKHILIYEFLRWEMPKTGHVPLLKEVGANSKMSKRFGDVAAVEFLKSGYFPEAILNFLMLLGWNLGTEQEIFTLEDFVEKFSLERIHKTDLVAFDREKLLWLNGYYIRKCSDEELLEKLTEWAKKWGVGLLSGGYAREYLLKVIGLIKDRMKVLSEYNELSSYFFTDPSVDLKTLTSYSKDNWKQILTGLLKALENVEISDWTKQKLDETGHSYIKDSGYSIKEAFMTLRVAVTGQTATPPLFDILELLGKETVLRRINTALTQNSI